MSSTKCIQVQSSGLVGTVNLSFSCLFGRFAKAGNDRIRGFSVQGFTLFVGNSAQVDSTALRLRVEHLNWPSDA